jgi:hypothetical protein
MQEMYLCHQLQQVKTSSGGNYKILLLIKVNKLTPENVFVFLRELAILIVKMVKNKYGK